MRQKCLTNFAHLHLTTLTRYSNIIYTIIHMDRNFISKDGTEFSVAGREVKSQVTSASPYEPSIFAESEFGVSFCG